MRSMVIKRVTGIVALLAGVLVMPVKAASVNFLGIDGMLGPGGVGAYPLDANFSWISHRYPGSVEAHIWTLAPGSDGGVIIGQAQSGNGEITASRAMYNQPSWLFSVGEGVRYDAQTQTFDLANLRLYWAGTIYDFGFAGGITSLVGTVTDAADTVNANGWWLDQTGDYHLVFRGDGQCEGCELTVHLTGQMTAVPVPAAVWLFGAGLVGLMGFSRKV